VETPCYPANVSIESLQPDHHEMLGLLRIRPRKCEFDPAADPLHDDWRRLVGDAGVAFDAQHTGEIQCITDARAHRIDTLGR
jgi:hypothetical protein